eukprot:scaffold183000_cov30-Attheya_sp.AAC.1
MLGMASSIPCCAAISRQPTDERNKSQTSQSLFTNSLSFCDFTKSSLKLPKPPKRHFCLCYSPARTVRSASTMFESATNRATYLSIAGGGRLQDHGVPAAWQKNSVKTFVE